jgi:hypothetical protein
MLVLSVNCGLNSFITLNPQVGEIRRYSHSTNPELLPYGYVFGDVNDIRVGLRRASSQHRGSGLTQPPVDELVTSHGNQAYFQTKSLDLGKFWRALQ